MRNRIKFIYQNYIYSILAVVTIVFWAGFLNLRSRDFLLILNGVYIGQMFAVVSMFGPYFFYVLTTREPYTRARQYAITTGFQHLGYLLVVTYSITARRYGGNPHVEVDLQLLASRYVILVAGFMQLTAPDLGMPALYGANRKALWIGSIGGLFAALGVIFLQFWPDEVVRELLYEIFGNG